MSNVEPLRDDEIEIRIYSSFAPGSGDFGHPQELVVLGKEAEHAQVWIIDTKYPVMQPPLVKVHAKAAGKTWEFSLHSGTCRRLVLSDRGYPDYILYSANPGISDE